MKPNSAPAMRGWRVVGIVVERRGEQFTENGDVPKETPEFYLEKGWKSRFHQEEAEFRREKREENWDKHFEAAFGRSMSHQDSGVASLTAKH